MEAVMDGMKGLGKLRLALIAGVAVILLGVFMTMAFRMSSAGMAPLYTNLSLEDSSKIVAELEKTGVPYELLSNGSQISVPSDRVLRLRMDMASQGIPSGGSVVGNEIFDRAESFGSSNFVMNINMERALEGELARTIGSLSGVDSARIHLVMPKRELFTRDKEKPSASVTIKMRGGKSLEHAEVTAITHLIASAVPGLEASKVTVVDSNGKLLARGDGDDSADAAATSAQEYRIAYETRTQQSLEDLLEKVIGAGKVRVTVAADINFDRTTINTEKFDPEGQVARSVQSTSQKENAQDKAGKDAVSVANQLPGAAAAGGDGNSSNKNVDHSDETTNYEISKTTQSQIKSAGGLNKISIAALVDGTYTTGADGKEVYAPRTDDEIKQMKALIGSAIGYDEKRGDKIEVVNMRFTKDTLSGDNESFFERYKSDVTPIIQTLMIAMVALAAILMVLRPAVSTLMRQSQGPSERVAGEIAALTGGGVGRLPSGSDNIGMGAGDANSDETLIDVANVKGGMKAGSISKINEIVEKYPEETMGVLRQWILKQS